MLTGRKQPARRTTPIQRGEADDQEHPGSSHGPWRGKVSGLAATIGILHSEVANDRLEINTLAGTDSVDSGGLAAGVIQLVVDGALVP
jgi:hypothetical protein